jgi:transcriptional regulator with XRE-family HTH domain
MSGSPSYREIVGRNVKRARTDAGLSQDALAEGVGAFLKDPWVKQTVYRIETGKRAVDADELLALSYLLNVTISTLLFPAWDEAMLLRGEGRVILASVDLEASDVAERIAPNMSFKALEREVARELAEQRALVEETKALAAELERHRKESS